MFRMKFFSRALFVLTLSIASVVTIAAQDRSDPADDFYRLTAAAPAAFEKGEFDNARAYAERLLVDAEAWPKNWNYGNAVHTANLVLGRLALRDSDVDAAKKYLLEAGKTPGSPQLNSFGPDMVLARELLKRGEKETVLEYFELCAVFWDKRSTKVPEWKEAVERDEIPDFGPNLRYVFHSAR